MPSWALCALAFVAVVTGHLQEAGVWAIAAGVWRLVELKSEGARDG